MRGNEYVLRVLTLGSGDESRVVEPCSVYSRRRTAVKRKYKGKEVALPSDGSHAVSLNTDRYEFILFFFTFYFVKEFDFLIAICVFKLYLRNYAVSGSI